MARPSISYILTLFDESLINSAWEVCHENLKKTNNWVFICSQLERCPTTGRLHWQAFVKLAKKQRGSWIKDHIDPRLHFTPVTVERAEAIKYGMKEESRVEGPLVDGIAPKAVDRHSVGGQRTKEQWDEIKKVVCLGDKSSVPTDIVIKYNIEKRFDGLRRFWTVDERQSLPHFLPNPWGWVLQSRLQAKRRHYWIFSRTPNRGKTTKFAEPLKEKFKCYIKCGDFNYWTIMGDEEAIILDEYNSPTLKWSSLNSICDGNFEYRIFMGGLITLKKPLIIVLSNQSISDLYPFMNNLLYERFNEKEIL